MPLPETPPDLPEIWGLSRRRIERRLRLVQILIAMERIWLESWLVRAVALFCVAMMLSGLLPVLPGWMHAGVLTAGVVSLLVPLLGMIRRFRWPLREDAIRRWEQGSAHRPLTASFDRLSRGGDPLTESLWLTHKSQARARVAGLEMTVSPPEVAERDPWGMRAIPVLAFVIAATMAWQDPVRRLEEAVSPGPLLSGQPLTADVWLTPPAYTGLPPLTRSLSLSSAASEMTEAIRAWRDLFVAVPEGTRLQLLLRSGGSPALQFGERPQTLETLDTGVRRWDVVLTADPEEEAPPEIRITSLWRTWLQWPVHVVADQPPSLAWGAPPSTPLRPGSDGVLTLPVYGDDDWGFVALFLEIQRAGEQADPVVLPLSGQPRALRSGLSASLVSHPWAALDVQVRVRGEDAAGQEGATEWATVTLPERVFTHPVARQIISLRKALMTATGGGMIPVAAGLNHLSSQPDAFSDDPVTFLALRLAALRVGGLSAIADSKNGQKGIGVLLWQTAVRVEDGRLAGARDALEQARQSLADALDRKASPAELQEAIAAIRQAAGAYISEMLNRMEGAEIPLSQMSGLALSADSLDRMMQSLEDLTRLGSTEAARQVMDQLSRALSRLQSGSAFPDPRQLEAAGRMIAALKEVVRQQEVLLQQTFGIRQDEPVRRKGVPSRFAGRGKELGGEQEALTARLQEIVGALGAEPQAMPPSLSEAEAAMGGAATALKTARWDDALEAQSDALAALKKGQGEALEAILPRGGPAVLMMPGGMGLSEDPTGRGGEAMGTSGQAIPDKPQRARAWYLLQELRRRASDRNRSPEELDYLNRLLKLF